jgi:YHS domain-containing protein
MRRLNVMLSLVVIGIFLIGSTVLVPEIQAKGVPQANCPVMGNPINKDHYVDYQGKRVYFCCAACPEEFKKDPAKYMKKLEQDGVALEEVKSN